MRKKVGFGLLGRTFGAKDKEDVSVAHDARLMLERLAERHRDYDFVVFSPSRETPLDAPNVTSPWDNEPIGGPHARHVAMDAIRPMDKVIVFVNSPSSVSVDNCPKLKGEGYVTPLVSASRTSAATIRALNNWMDDDPVKRDVTYVVNDSRSLLVCRDLKWPPKRPVLAQYNMSRWQQHYRFRDNRRPEDFGYLPNDVIVNRRHWTALQVYESADIPHLVL